MEFACNHWNSGQSGKQEFDVVGNLEHLSVAWLHEDSDPTHPPKKDTHPVPVHGFTPEDDATPPPDVGSSRAKAARFRSGARGADHAWWVKKMPIGAVHLSRVVFRSTWVGRDRSDRSQCLGGNRGWGGARNG